MTSTTTETEVAALRRAVHALQEELDRRDVEQMELEGAVEFLLDRSRMLTDDQSVRQRILDLVASHDCEGLQNEFDTADANNAATMTRTGHGNAELMGSIDAGLRTAGCY